VKNPAASVAALSGVNIGKEDKARQLKDKKVNGVVIVYYCLNLIICSYPKIFLSAETASWALYS
jgi:hypothetical protein